MLTGFVLLITSTLHAIPVSQRIYSTLTAYEMAGLRILDWRPTVQLEFYLGVEFFDVKLQEVSAIFS